MMNEKEIKKDKDNMKTTQRQSSWPACRGTDAKKKNLAADNEHVLTKAEKKKAEKAIDGEKKSGEKKPFILFRPFVAFGHYIRDSFREVRQVRWPDRKSTWKMTLSVVVYVILIAATIMLLDAFFTFIFNQLLKNV